MTADSSQMAEILSDQYQSVFSKPKNPKDIHILGEKVKHTIGNIEVSAEQIEAAIDELRNTSASGPDGVSNVRKSLLPLLQLFGTNVWKKDIFRNL